MAKWRKSKQADRPQSSEPEPAATAAAPGVLVSPRRTWPLRVVLFVVIGLSAVLHLHHLRTRPPNFDEHVQLQFLWLTSQAVLPRDGFLCPYPPTAYYLFGPLLNLVPQVPGLFVFLRGCTLVPFIGLVAALAAAAQHLGRRGLLTAALILALAATGRFAALWEIRFDLPAWCLTMTAFLVLLKARRLLDVATASGLAFTSVMISPKHVCLVAGLAAGFGLWRLICRRRGLGGAVVAALVGAAVPVLALTVVRPSFVDDLIELSLMNYRTQLLSTYSETLTASLLALIVRDPVATSVVWAGPVLVLLNLRRMPAHVAFMSVGMLLGAAGTIAMLPCGYDHYLTLAWAVFLPTAIWMTPRPESRVATRALVAGLLILLGLRGAREAQTWREDHVARHLRLQQEFSRLCPPGEVFASAPFTHAWFRQNVAYVFIDNVPSYRAEVRAEHRAKFTAEYFYDQLVARPPATFCHFTVVDNQPPEYAHATAQFLDRHADEYSLMQIPCDIHPSIPRGMLPVYVRKDRVAFAVDARPARLVAK